MRVLAIELSSARGNLALLQDGEVDAEQSWTETRSRNQCLFSALPELLTEAGCSLEKVDLYACGRGPGAFSGLRMALTFARSAALPGGQPVYAVSSGEALATEVLAASDAPCVAVVGDARRGSLWFAVFHRGAAGPEPPAWNLTAGEQFLADIPPEALVVTSAWERVRNAVPPEALLARQWHEGDWFPSAAQVGRLALGRQRSGLPSEPLEPLYMHPPV